MSAGRLGVLALAAALAGAAAAPSCKLGSAPAAVCQEGLHPSDAGVDAADASDAGDAADAEPSDAGTPRPCWSCAEPVSCGTVENGAIANVAGLAASKLHEGVFYLQNGPPDVARFFAIDETGSDRGEYRLTGAANVDWEDLAVGPCPAGSCVFLADVGDPREARGQYVIYRVTEPAVVAEGEADVVPDAFPFSYPDGSHDAAAILVHPVTGVVSVVTRDHGGSGTRVYDLPAALPGQPVTATLRGSIDLGLGVAVTAASVLPDAGPILLRTTSADAGALGYEVAPDAGKGPLAASLVGVQRPCAASIARQTDGENIAWLRTGRGYLAIDRGQSASLSYVFCPASR